MENRGKAQKYYRYHTEWLVPEKVAIEAREQPTEAGQQEVLDLWAEAHRSGHHFKEMDTVYHIRDLWTPLGVDKILRAKPKPVNGEKQKSRILGVQVHWHEPII